MRRPWQIVLFAFPAMWAPQIAGYELTGRIEPRGAVSVYLHGALTPFESSTISGRDGRFQFAKIPAGTYTLVISTSARGEVVQTVELSSGTVDSRGRLDLALTLGTDNLEGRGTGAMVSKASLAVPERAMKEYADAQHCFSGRNPNVACAASHLRRAVQVAPRFMAAWNQLGTIAYQAHRYPEAESDFRKGLEADPAAFEPLVNLAGVLLNLNRLPEALDFNLLAVARRPNDALANSQLGICYFDLGEDGPAEKYLKIAVQLDPAHFSNPQLALAEIYLKRDQKTEGIGQMRDFLQRHPDSPEAAKIRSRIDALSR